MPRAIEAVLPVGERWLRFTEPVQIVGADRAAGVGPALANVERLTRDQGLHAVGFVAYEAGAAYGLRVHPPAGDLPLAWFALFDSAHVEPVERPARSHDYSVGPLAPSVDRAAFGARFEAIKARLGAGDTYQVNFTFKMSGPFEGDAFDLFADLVNAQGGRHSAFIRIGDWAICSASPELFFELDGVTVRSRPMKGTTRRGRTLAEDRERRDALRSSPKEQAENVMIVDMLRNDLGRIAEVGSMAVPELYAVERYPHVWQMTSLVTARSTASLQRIFAAVHPSASITGAPKVSTMEILQGLETEPRGVYTGAIGYVPPDGNARFSVAIRTAVVDDRARTVEFGIGSGIVWDSDADAEYAECLLKGAVLGRKPEPFDLLETLRWSPREGYFLLERHLARLRESAEYFEFAWTPDLVTAALDEATSGAHHPLRVRLLVSRDGTARAERVPFVAAAEPVRIALAQEPVDSGDVRLFHKTTNRAVYERARVSMPGYDEVVLWNQAGEVTEATTANVVAEIDGRRVTPPVTCGLLAGTFRAELLARGEVAEAVVTCEQLRTASRIWLVNSVQERRPAVLNEVSAHAGGRPQPVQGWRPRGSGGSSEQ